MDHAKIGHKRQFTHADADAVRRSVIACNRCRSRKTKCAGLPPYSCKSCRDTGNLCVYTDPEKRINVSERYLLELLAQAKDPALQAANRIRADDEYVSGINTRRASPPLADEEWGRTGFNNWVVGQSGQHHFVGNSSSTYIANRLNPTAETLAWHLYPQYQDTRWLRRPVYVTDLPELPPYDMARCMYHAQYRYIGTIFSFLKEEDFYQRLDRMYSGPPDLENQEDCLVHCQMLLVLAFGQQYSVNQWVSSDGPPGFVYFKAALQYLPSAYEDGSILFVEVLGHVAYYMQTLNRRDAAYLHIGLALRMAISLGLHREVLGNELDESSREHRRRVWWSLYSMERLFSVTSGHPPSVRDEDIDLRYPQPVGSEDPRAVSILRSYTLLSGIQGIIGNEVYLKKPDSKNRLSASVRGVMQKLADWFTQLPDNVKLDVNNLDSDMSREKVSMYLHYYHCINMTARPFLLYATQRQMANNTYPRPNGTQAERWDVGLSPQIVNVIEDAIAAARTSALLLNKAAKHNMLANFGFLDGEQAFSTALLFVMVNIAFSYDEKNVSSMNMALQALQGMAKKGNRYIQACHAFLTRVMANKELTQPPARLANTADVSTSGTNGIRQDQLQPQHLEQPHPQEAQMQQQQEQTNEGSYQRPQATPLNLNDGLQSDTSPLTPNLPLDGDPTIWADVLDSIGINMDRQWIEMAFLADKSRN